MIPILIEANWKEIVFIFYKTIALFTVFKWADWMNFCRHMLIDKRMMPTLFSVVSRRLYDSIITPSNKIMTSIVIMTSFREYHGVIAGNDIEMFHELSQIYLLSKTYNMRQEKTLRIPLHYLRANRIENHKHLSW